MPEFSDRKRRGAYRNSIAADSADGGEGSRLLLGREPVKSMEQRLPIRAVRFPALLGFAALACLARAAGEEPKAPSNPAYRRPDFALFHSGRYVFERHCMICHGADGDGRGELSVTLPVKPRSFLQGYFKYRSTPPGKLPTDATCGAQSPAASAEPRWAASQRLPKGISRL